MRVEGSGDRGVSTGPADLGERWRAASLSSGWTVPGDWWVPAVDAVTEAVGDGRDPAPACLRLGRARAAAGVGLEEAFADLAALQAVLGPGGAGGLRTVRGAEAVPPRLLRALALGWAEVACAPAGAGGCDDPMTGLVTTAYLRTRLVEVYREAEQYGMAAGAGSAFVVTDPGVTEPLFGEAPSGGPGTAGPSDLTRLGRALTVAETIRGVFRGGETLCAPHPARVLALVVREPELALRVARLRRLLTDRLPGGGRPVRVWVEGLPGTVYAAHRLVDDLSR